MSASVLALSLMLVHAPSADCPAIEWLFEPIVGNASFAQLTALLPQVSAIDSCIREPPGRLQCARVQEPLDDYNK